MTAEMREAAIEIMRKITRADPSESWSLAEIEGIINKYCGPMHKALTKINEIRNSIIGFQTVGFSEHVYPLVAALNEAGYSGEGYEEARKNVKLWNDRLKEAYQEGHDDGGGDPDRWIEDWHASDTREGL